MAFNALSTLNVRRTERFPRLTNSVTYLRENGKQCHLVVLVEAGIQKPHTKDYNARQQNTVCDRHLRHDNDAEIQPVPGIPQKRELPYTKTSR